jgi:hypothetical protein
VKKSPGNVNTQNYFLPLNLVFLLFWVVYVSLYRCGLNGSL